jgi:hypothetical protein
MIKQVRIIWIILFIIGLLLRTTELFHPLDIEMWREIDMGTIARNFYLHGMNIFHPQVLWDGRGPGYTESEFQLYTYLIAVSYKIFGFWEPTGRIISFLFSLGTMIVFFKLSNYLFKTGAAIATSAFFVFSPLLIGLSNTTRPEPLMFFFYICSAYAFIRWIDRGSRKDYFWATIFTALAILCKLPAAHIGIFFILLIIVKKGWRFIFNRKVLIFGVLSLLPSIIWYSYCHQFYILYGNSLGLSNQYAWVGWDFFTDRYFIRGIIKNELTNIWSISGPIIVFLGIIFTKMIKKETSILAICWLGAVSIFYFIASRTTADTWAFYYHIFSVPAASILLGSSVVELYNKFSPWLNLRRKTSIDRLNFIKSGMIISFLTILVSYFAIYSVKYLIKTNNTVLKTSGYYFGKDALLERIPKGSLILASGGFRMDGTGYPVAYNSSYFFYWLDRKGYNIPSEDQSIENITSFKKRGVSFFIAEIRSLNRKPGLEGDLKKRFKAILESNGIILFAL